MLSFLDALRLVTEQMFSTRSRSSRQNIITVAALGSDSYLLARGQGLKDRLEVVPGTRPGTLKVNLTGGNRSGLTGYRSNRSGPVPVPAGTQPAKIQILNLNSKNEKFPKNS